MSDDSHFEPVYGLPGLLPPGERILWQGSPRWQSLARRAFWVGRISIYFVLLFGWDIASALYAGRGGIDILQTMFVPVVLAAAACSSLLAVAYLSARSTVYTITNRRVAIRTGLAFSVTINLPFSLVDAVGLKTHRDGTGDVPLALTRAERAGYFVCWPNVRPWRITRVEPMLRCIGEPERVGQLLATAISESGARAASAAPVRSPAVVAPNAVAA